MSAWVPGSPGPVRLAAGPAMPLGEPVALGPEEAAGEHVRYAVDALTRLISAGGVAAAGAGVDLGSGFRSARLAGARGDQRDAVLAALQALGVEQLGRLGDRAGVLVALFGPAATKRVGTAAMAAITDGRWAAVRLASAASDILGPEQLERVLTLRPAEGADLIQGPVSALAEHLRRVLEPLPGPRRLELLADMWAQVAEQHAALARRGRLLATQSRRDRVEDLRKRRQHADDQRILLLLPRDFTRPEPSVTDIARWMPPDGYWHDRCNELVSDALAATALLRVAIAVADHGLQEGLARSAKLLGVAETLLPDVAAAGAARKMPGFTGLPSRPGVYLRDIHRRLSGDKPADRRFEAFVKPRLACARDFALVIIHSALELLQGDENTKVPHRVLRRWAGFDLRSWRKSAGYSPVRPPAEWDGVPFWPEHFLWHREPLSQRLAAAPGSDAADVEVAGDLLWYADLVDALAALYGHDTAKGPIDQGLWFDHDPARPAEPLSPRRDSVTLAASGAAQLIALGATPPRHTGQWREFVEGLVASISVTEAMTSEFVVPASVAAVDGTRVNGLRFRVARSARTLAEWSDFMGNCIAGQGYLNRAAAGRSVLAGLYDKNGVLVINAELVPRRPAARGWRVDEIAARFNHEPDAAVERRFREWVQTIPGEVSAEAEPAEGRTVEVLPGLRPAALPRRKRPASRLIEGAGPALCELASTAWAAEVDAEVTGAFAALAGTAPDAALARLLRMRPGSLAETCRRALDAGAVELGRLWAVTGVRPLRTAVDGADPALRDQLSPLFTDPPLAKSLRDLVKLPAIDAAYALDRTARVVRRALGTLAIRDDPVVTRALAGRPAEALLCALTVMITCSSAVSALVAPAGEVAVPGYPASTLDDENGPWQRALADAAELGADSSGFWDQIAAHGLRVQASWLTAGGWTALWARAHK